MTSIRQLEKEIIESRSRQAQLEDELKAARANKIIPCAACGGRNRIKDTKLISVQAYQEPYGCTGGAYWYHSEYNFKCCKCSVRNRFLFNDKYSVRYDDRKHHNAEQYFFRDYHDLFAGVERECEERSHVFAQASPFVNNFFVCKNIQKFLSKERYQKLSSYYQVNR